MENPVWRELLHVAPSSVVLSLGAACIGYYSVHQRPVFVFIGILLFITGYRVPQYTLYADKQVSEQFPTLESPTTPLKSISHTSLRNFCLISFGVAVLSFGLPLGATGFHEWDLLKIAASGLLFFIGYVSIHVPLNDAVV